MIGSTFVLIKAKEEENSFFGGMAVPSWKNNGTFLCDP